MKRNLQLTLTGLCLLALFAPGRARAESVFRLQNAFTQIYRLASPSRTPLYQTDTLDIEPLLPSVTKIRVRGLDQCSRSPIARWNLDEVIVNGGSHYRHTNYGSDQQGSYTDVDLGGSADVASVQFGFSTLDAGATGCYAPVVEFWYYGN